MILPGPPLLAGAEETALRFKSMPPAWLIIMLIIPATVALIWWLYRRESPTATPKAKNLLAAFRIATILVILLLLFQPYAETSIKKLVRSHLVVLIDSSASMEFVDTYADAGKAEKTRAAAALGGRSPSEVSRINLVKGVLGNEELRILDGLAEKFHLHVYTFDAETALLASAAESGLSEEDALNALPDRIRDLRAAGGYTFIGEAVDEILEEFRLRDEPLAGVMLFTDGRQNGGTVEPIEAARKAAEGQAPSPLFLVGVGDPDLPRNIHVSNLRAKEVVLRGDDVSFEFSVSHKGFAGDAVTVTLLTLDSERRVEQELDLRGADVVLGEEDVDQTVKVSHNFRRPGFYTLRVGIPVRRGEKIESDNFLVHHLQVVDKKIKVLYVDGYPRWEYRFLKDALTRDTETVLAHVINLDSDPSQVVQPFSDVPGWGPRQRFPVKKEELYEYDIVIFGDVDWQRLGESEAESKQALENLKSFVEDGGGFIMIAGPDDSPRSYRSTPVRDILPVVLNLDEELRANQDPTVSFNFVLTEEGRRHPVMQLEDNEQTSRTIWEEDRFSAQFWYYPVERAKSAATALAVHPGQYNRNARYGPHVLLASMPFGKGRTLYVGVDELWRLRWSFGDKYHYRFYGEAIRLLATYKLLGGNLRFKIFTDRNRYFIGDPATISAEVYDRDFNPSSAEIQRLKIRSPDGLEQEIVLARVPDDPGNYRTTVTVNQEGTYFLAAEMKDDEGQTPQHLFEVEYSTEEMRNPLIDLTTMEAMAKESGGAFKPLFDAGQLIEEIPSRSVFISTAVRSEDLWDDTWILFLITGLLAAEWMIRKRYRLL